MTDDSRHDAATKRSRPPSRSVAPSKWRLVWSAGAVLAALIVPAPSPAGDAASRANGPVELRVDGSKTIGRFRPLHGVNGGPLHLGETLNLAERHRALRIPLTRLHDCNWPNPDVVDMHAVFPDPRADPNLPESYCFGRTDEYLRAVVESGSAIVYRLGESIEHARVKRHVHPPADPQRWAAACVGVIRHYNEGWADGFHFGIRYWEIWNEPENRPAMWTGNDEQFLRLFSETARTIKAQFPELRVGGPGVGDPGRFVGGRWEPSAFVVALLEHCRREAVPLDFFSWHLYTNDPDEPARRARAVREMLDRHGFARAESHLNEWNYLPDNDWTPMLAPDPAVRRRWFERIGGVEGASFTAAVLMALQDAPVDAANYYSASLGGFGLFDAYGVPRASYEAMLAFKRLADAPRRLAVDGPMPRGLAIAAGLDPAWPRLMVLLSRCAESEIDLRLHVVGLPWRGPSICRESRVGAAQDESRAPAESRVPEDSHAPGECRIQRRLPPWSIALLVFEPDRAVPVGHSDDTGARP